MSKIILFLIGIYFFLFPLGNILTIQEGMTILPIFGYLTIFIFITCMLLSPKIIKIDRTDIFLGIFIFLMGIATVTHANVVEGFTFWLSNLQLAFLTILLRSIIDDDNILTTLFIIIILSLSIAASLMILEEYQIISLGVKLLKQSDVTRAAGANKSAYYFSMGILLCLFIIKRVKEPLYKILILIAIIFL